MVVDTRNVKALVKTSRGKGLIGKNGGFQHTLYSELRSALSSVRASAADRRSGQPETCTVSRRWVDVVIGLNSVAMDALNSGKAYHSVNVPFFMSRIAELSGIM